MSDAFLSIYKTNGIFGLWRGVTGAMNRVTVGSAVQLSTFSTAKELVMKTGVCTVYRSTGAKIVIYLFLHYHDDVEIPNIIFCL